MNHLVNIFNKVLGSVFLNTLYVCVPTAQETIEVSLCVVYVLFLLRLWPAKALHICTITVFQ